MRAVAAHRPGVIGLVDLPKPDYGNYDVLIQTEASGFCSSTDMKIIEGDLHNVNIRFPLILGHEGVGRVVATGSRVRNAGIGQRYMFSTSRIADGTEYVSMWAGMAEYAVMTDVSAMIEDGIDQPKGSRPIVGLIPDSISSVAATSILTVAENFSALKNFGMKPGDDVLIYGDGSVGFGLAKLARHIGAGHLVCIGHHDDRLESISRSANADTCINSNSTDPSSALGDQRFALVIDAVGKADIILKGTRFLEPGGTLGAYGVLHRADAQINLVDLPNHIRLHMLNFPSGEFDVHDEMVQLVVDGIVDLQEYYTHVLPVEDCPDALELIRSREALKVVFTY